MSYSDNTFKLQYLCVDTDIQSHGAGGKMLEYLEKKALEKMLSYAPVPHILMEKREFEQEQKSVI